AADLENKAASFNCAVAYADEETVEVFEGTVEGRLVAPRGDGGFGYDPIFEYEGQTFAELSMAAKNEISHRARALSKLASWLENGD
ncbi:MAG: non-canonical purine NTP pyrophosphatase, partial [Halodesulfurarchaeum sp.]|nr:non-canonical purine NTP pyrophosphatase [Halodesulfurarchaeum sp.]